MSGQAIRASRTIRVSLVTALSLGLLGSVGAGGAMASTITGTAATPVYIGDAVTNNLSVTQLASGVTVWNDSVAVTTAVPNCANNTPAAGDVTCSPPGGTLSPLDIFLGAGNDTTSFTGVIVSVTQSGQDGDDSLGVTGAGTIASGGIGNDTLRAGSGENYSQLSGDAGNDTLVGSTAAGHRASMRGGTGADDFVAGAGSDSVVYVGAVAVTVTADDVANDGIAGEGDNVRAGIEDIVGSSAPDTIIAGPVDNTLEGGDGNDVVSGGGGDDDVFGGSGDDTLDGQGGDDTFEGGAGADDVRGGEGVDAVFAADFGPGPAFTPLDISVTLDDVANDGSSGEGDNVRSDIEDIHTQGGNDTIIGNAGLQIISGQDGNDTIDGGAGNDVLSGRDGDDTMRSRDGFADRVDCGAGTDNATVDTLDVVSANCETVSRADVGNANDIPEDAPPTVAFTAPAQGARVRGGVVTTAIAAADDRGIARVILLDDGKTVGSDSTAPYQIAYQPTGADVGRNTLIALAVDTAGQTVSAVRPIILTTFTARSVTLKVSPARDRRAPYVFTASGTIRRPAGVSASQGCRGTVRVDVRKGGRTVRRTAKVERTCTYSVRIRVASRGRATFKARFSGNSVLRSRDSATRRGRAG